MNEFKAKNGLITPVVTSTIPDGTPPLVVTSTTPVANLSIGGNAGSTTKLATSRSIYGSSFDGTLDLSGIIASTYGGTGNGFTKFTGPTTTEKTFTLPDSSATLLYSGGALGTPSSGSLSNCTFPTLNQDTTGTAAKATILATSRSIYGGSFNGSADVTGTVAVLYGGTGAGTANAAKVNLSVVTSLTGSEILPVGTTAERDATPFSGYMRFNSDIAQFEGYNGAAWASVGGSAISNDTSSTSNLYPVFVDAVTGTALNVYTSNAKYLYKPSTGELQAPELIANNGIVVNSATISTNYTIAAGNNAMSTGPVTINSGITVSVSPGSRWLVL